MSEAEVSIVELRERLDGLLADWGAEASVVLTELERRRQSVERLWTDTASRQGETENLEKQLRGQSELIETLKGEAAEAAELRRDLQAKEVEIDRLTSERESKQELIRALRRDAEQLDRLKSDSRVKDREVNELRQQNAALTVEAERLRQTVQSLREELEAGEHDGSAEVESMRAELEARKRLVKSLQTDAERAQMLEERLEEKRHVIRSLEESINRHADTIAELKRSADAWKRRYRSLRGGEAAATNADLPALSGTATDVEEPLPIFPEHFDIGPDRADRTIAIDMRQSLIEARRTAHGRSQK